MFYLYNRLSPTYSKLVEPKFITSDSNQTLLGLSLENVGICLLPRPTRGIT